MEKIESKENPKPNEKECAKGNGKSWVAVGVLLFVGMAIMLFRTGVLVMPSQGAAESEKGAVVNRVSTRFAVEKALAVEQLWTFKQNYQGVAKVSETKKNGKVKDHYSVKYSGSAVGGINGRCSVSVDEDYKIITVTLPEASVVDIQVDFGSMQFMWNKSKYNTETVSAEAYKACVKHLKEIVARDTSLLESAKRSSIAQVESLMQPFKKEYRVVVQ